MYEECTRIPFIVRGPGIPAGTTCDEPVTLMDLLPTVLDYAGQPQPNILQGQSLRPLFENPLEHRFDREAVQIQFNRFGVYHDGYGGFYPIRCALDGRFKLALNLFDEDELYDLANDPDERQNLINDPSFTRERDRLHDWLLQDMERCQDPLRGHCWNRRSWRQIEPQHTFYGLEKRACLGLPETFDFDPRGMGSGRP